MDGFSENLRELLELGQDDEPQNIDISQVDAKAGMLEFGQHVDDKKSRPNDEELESWYKLLQFGGAVHVGSGRYIAALKKKHSLDLENAVIKLHPTVDEGASGKTSKDPKKRGTESSVRPTDEYPSEPLDNWGDVEEQIEDMYSKQYERARDQNFYHIQEPADELLTDSFGQVDFFTEDVPADLQGAPEQFPEPVEFQEEEVPVPLEPLDASVADLQQLIVPLAEVSPSALAPPIPPAPVVPVARPAIRRPRNRLQRIIDEDAARPPMLFWMESPIDRWLYADVDFYDDLPMDSFEEGLIAVYNDHYEEHEEPFLADVLEPEVLLGMPEELPHLEPLLHEPEQPFQEPEQLPPLSPEETVAEVPMIQLEEHILALGSSADPSQRFFVNDFIVGEVTPFKRVSVFRCLLKYHDAYKLTIVPTGDLDLYVLFDQDNNGEESTSS